MGVDPMPPNGVRQIITAPVKHFQYKYVEKVFCFYTYLIYFRKFRRRDGKIQFFIRIFKSTYLLEFG